MHPVLFTLPVPVTELALLPALVSLCGLGLLLVAYGYLMKVRGLPTFGVGLMIVTGSAAYLLRNQALTLGPIAVPAWGFALGAWLTCAYRITANAATRLALDSELLANTFVVSAISALFASRAVFVLTAPDTTIDPLALGQGGLSGFGAVLGAIFGAYLFLRRRSPEFWQWLDLNAANLCLGVIVIRLGCYLHGCDYGSGLSSSSPVWLQELGRFPRWGDPDLMPVAGAQAWLDQVSAGRLGPEAHYAAPVHPLQLYEAVLGLCLFGFVLHQGPRRVFHGQTGLGVLFGYALGRFLLLGSYGSEWEPGFGPLLEARVYLPVGLLLFATAYTYGPALSIPSPRRRYLSIALSLVPAVLAFALSFDSRATARRLTSSEWLALMGAGVIAYAWSRRYQSPLAERG